MGAGHAHSLYVHEHSPLHRMAPEAKILAMVGMVAVAALTPREQVVAFVVYGCAVAALLAVAKVRPGFIAARLTALAPFFLFALAIPFVASGETIEVVGVRLSIEGLWGAWNVFAKALIGGSLSVLLTATTEVPDIIAGLGRLRVPAVLVSIAGFMIRYLEVVAEELRRMRVAMTARAYDPRWLAQARPIATGAGALFVRSYERGERVHGAMLARGFTGVMPDLTQERATRWEWTAAVLAVAAFATVATLTWWLS